MRHLRWTVTLALSTVALLALCPEPGFARRPSGLSKVIKAFRSARFKPTSAKMMHRYHAAARLVSRYRGQMSLDEASLLGRAKNSALVSINRQLAREKGQPVPSLAQMRRRLKEVRDQRYLDRFSWLKKGTIVVTKNGARGTLDHWMIGSGGDAWAVKLNSGNHSVFYVKDLRPEQLPQLRSYGLWLGD